VNFNNSYGGARFVPPRFVRENLFLKESSSRGRNDSG
jgi:hypothetical protein